MKSEERRVKNPIANVMLTSRNHNTFGFFVFHFSLLTFHFRKMHYVAIVPADLCSAGIEYKDLFNPITSYFVSR